MDKNFHRLFSLLGVLQRGQWLSTQVLHQRLEAQGFDVTVRTMQRDLEDLSAVYPLECRRDAKPYQWRWQADSPSLSMPSMAWPELISFYLLDSYLDGVIPPMVRDGIRRYVEEARRRVRERADAAPLRFWTQRVRVVASDPAFHSPKVSRAVHEAVSEAVLFGKRLELHYAAFGESQARRHSVSPLGLVLYGSVFYLPVRFDGYRDVRTLTLHRVRRAHVLDEAADREGFDLDAWIEAGALGFGGTETVKLEVRFFEDVGKLVIEAPLSTDQVAVEEGPGLHHIAATVLDTPQLRRWLLSFGDRAEVLTPLALRQAIGRALVLAAERYQDGPP